MTDVLVTLKDGRIVQVTNVRMDVSPSGSLVFVRGHTSADPSYILCIFASGQWVEASAMSQATGHANGYEVIKRGKK